MGEQRPLDAEQGRSNRTGTNSVNTSTSLAASNWAAPYDSVEKTLWVSSPQRSKALPPEEFHDLGADQTQRWGHFRQAFVDSA